MKCNVDSRARVSNVMAHFPVVSVFIADDPAVMHYCHLVAMAHSSAMGTQTSPFLTALLMLPQS